MKNPNVPKLPHSLSHFVWHYLKNRKLYLLGFALIALIWALEMSLTPYLLKVSIDIVEQYPHDNTAIPGEKMVNSLIFKENKGESLRKQILQPIDLKGKKPSPGITDDNSKMLAAITFPAALYVGVSILLNFNFRWYDYLNLRLYPAIKADVTNDMFAYLCALRLELSRKSQNCIIAV